jgi:penicillin amidase
MSPLDMLGVMLRGVLTRLGRRRLPQISGSQSVFGIESNVEILRDRWGVPHIFANNQNDLFFAQGFVHGQDRLWQMELGLRMAKGTLSELFGKRALDTDRVIRTFGWSGLGRKDLELFDDGTRRMIEAYARGVNAAAECSTKRPVEFSLLGCRPSQWSPEDVTAFSRLMIWKLSSSWYGELVQARIRKVVGEERAKELEFEHFAGNPFTLPKGIEFNVLDPDKTFGAGPFLQRGGGSNAWALSSGKTTTAGPLLCNDMHLYIGIPSLWYEVHLSGGGMNVSGVSLPGLPMVMVGHNEKIAWGITMAYTDCEDLFIEQTDPNDPSRYMFRGEWREAERREERIAAKGAKTPHVETVRATHHGPVISAIEDCGNQSVAVSSMALRPGPSLRGWRLLNRAGNWDDFSEAVRCIESPQLNIVYADVEGNIGYWTSGKVPVRAQGNGTVPVPGWTGEHEWTGHVPFDEMPHALNPEQGYIVNCNQKMVPPDYPHFLGATFFNGFRAKRVVDSIEEKERLSVGDCSRIQRDLKSLPGSIFADHLRKLETDEPDIMRARGILAGWDGQLLAESVPACLYEVISNHFLYNLVAPKLGDKTTRQLLGEGFHPILQGGSELWGHKTDILLRMLDRPNSWWVREAGGLEALLARSVKEAFAWLRRRLGPDIRSWRWGRIHYLVVAHPFGRRRPFDVVFNRGPYPMGGDTDTPLQTGTSPSSPYGGIKAAPSHRQIIDLHNLSKSLMIHPPGQSGQLGSPHYDDLLEPWLAGEYHPMLWAREEIESACEARLTLQPIEASSGPSRAAKRAKRN